ncbi:hypothetical protein FACS1894172_03170 [Spirochaetia bacterium]|nr:hypothetical protein FACS1894164_19170 [Spirochaetia bacterium]GHU30262.1 hypothetical protein FACS1894172_03170 [Spirochaetia bacterium]
MKDKIITVDDVSKTLNVAKSTIYSYASQSKIPQRFQLPQPLNDRLIRLVMFNQA